MVSSPPIVAQRVLSCETDSGVAEVTVTFFRPETDGGSWRCDYEIGWPSAARRSFAGGADSVQALLLAFMKAGAELYFQRPEACRKLWWTEVDKGVGLPLPPSVKDAAIGDDKFL